jgi:hypothetical protein
MHPRPSVNNSSVRDTPDFLLPPLYLFFFVSSNAFRVELQTHVPTLPDQNRTHKPHSHHAVAIAVTVGLRLHHLSSAQCSIVQNATKGTRSRHRSTATSRIIAKASSTLVRPATFLSTGATYYLAIARCTGHLRLLAAQFAGHTFKLAGPKGGKDAIRPVFPVGSRARNVTVAGPA